MIKFPQIDATPTMRLFANAWLALTRIVQSLVEHVRVTNAEATALVDGELLHFSPGVKQALRTTALSSKAAEFACVSCEPIAASGRGIARTQGLTWVLFEAGLVAPAPAAEQAVYTSTTPGRATNSAPKGAGEFYVRIGIIEDASTYATQGGCYVNINRCCVPVTR